MFAFRQIWGCPGGSRSRTWYSRKEDDAANILNSSKPRRYHDAVFRLKSPSTVAVELRTGGLQAGKQQERREGCWGLGLKEQFWKCSKCVKKEGNWTRNVGVAQPQSET